jgi:hypothetical protein
LTRAAASRCRALRALATGTVFTVTVAAFAWLVTEPPQPVAADDLGHAVAPPPARLLDKFAKPAASMKWHRQPVKPMPRVHLDKQADQHKQVQAAGERVQQLQHRLTQIDRPHMAPADLATRLATVQSDRRAAESRLAVAEQRVQHARQRLASTRPMHVIRVMQMNPAHELAREQLEAARAQLRQLDVVRRMTPLHPQRKAARAAVEQLQTLVATTPRLRVIDLSAKPNPAWEAWSAELAQAEPIHDRLAGQVLAARDIEARLQGQLLEAESVQRLRHQLAGARTHLQQSRVLAQRVRQRIATGRAKPDLPIAVPTMSQARVPRAPTRPYRRQITDWFDQPRRLTLVLAAGIGAGIVATLGNLLLLRRKEPV